MTFGILAAMRLPMTTLLGIGGSAAFVIIIWSFTHWRAAVKTAFVVALLEGAIRKWVFPQGQELVYFLKDVFLMGAYLKFFLSPDMDIRAWRLKLPTFFVLMVCGAVGLGALNPNIDSFILSVFGLKLYLFYLPLLFMMPYLFRSEQEMIRQLTWYALIAIPICLLGVAQYGAGAFSPLNVYAQSSEDGASGFGFGDKVRITGTFSYITGHATFVNFFVTLCLVLLSARETRWKWLIVVVALPLLAANAMMGGSRAVLYVGGLVTMGLTISAFSGKIGVGTRFREILVTSLVIGSLAIGYLFYDAYFVMSRRTTLAEDGFVKRVFEHPTKALSYAIEQGGISGLGIGLGHPASRAMKGFLKIDGPKKGVTGVEAEPGQVYLEIGLLGFLAWYGFRLMLIWYCWRSYQQAKTQFQKTLALAAFWISIPYLMMGVVLNHTANLLLFGLCGLAMLPQLEPLIRRRTRSAGPEPIPDRRLPDHHR